MINWGFSIKRLREARGLTQQELADQVGITRSLLSRYELGDVETFSQDKLTRFARALEMTPAELNDHIFGNVPEQGAKYVREPLGKGRMEVQPIAVYTQFPFHAGSPTEPSEYVYRAVPKDAAKNVEGYIVRGTCLTPVVMDGDTIIVDRERAVDNGDIVACMIDDELHIARLKSFAGELWLENNNGKRRLQDCRTSAVVIEIVRRLK